MEIFKIKDWFVNKEQQKAKGYSIWFDIAERNEDGTIKNDNGFIALFAEKLAETEKAVKLHIGSGSVDGSYKGWTTWVPKSVMA